MIATGCILHKAHSVYCYLEFKLRSLKKPKTKQKQNRKNKQTNKQTKTKLFSIRVKELMLLGRKGDVIFRFLEKPIVLNIM